MPGPVPSTFLTHGSRLYTPLAQLSTHAPSATLAPRTDVNTTPYILTHSSFPATLITHPSYRLPRTSPAPVRKPPTRSPCLLQADSSFSHQTLASLHTPPRPQHSPPSTLRITRPANQFQHHVARENHSATPSHPPPVAFISSPPSLSRLCPHTAPPHHVIGLISSKFITPYTRLATPPAPHK